MSTSRQITTSLKKGLSTAVLNDELEDAAGSMSTNTYGRHMTQWIREIAETIKSLQDSLER